MEAERQALEKRHKEKDRKIANLESKIGDKDEEKVQLVKEHGEEMEAQRNLMELQMTELKKRVQELTDKYE